MRNKKNEKLRNWVTLTCPLAEVLSDDEFQSSLKRALTKSTEMFLSQY